MSFWRSYIDFVQEYDVSVSRLSAAGISKARDLFERALTATGLHVAEGNSIWEAYREFEQAIFLTIDEADTQVRTIRRKKIVIPFLHCVQRSCLLICNYFSNELLFGNIHITSYFKQLHQMYFVLLVGLSFVFETFFLSLYIFCAVTLL